MPIAGGELRPRRLPSRGALGRAPRQGSGARLRLRSLRERDAHGPLLVVVAHHGQVDGVARTVLLDQLGQRRLVLDWLAVDLGDYISALQAGAGGGRPVHDALNDYPRLLGKALLARAGAARPLEEDSQVRVRSEEH